METSVDEYKIHLMMRLFQHGFNITPFHYVSCIIKSEIPVFQGTRNETIISNHWFPKISFIVGIQSYCRPFQLLNVKKKDC
jgi:hypothetical protein